MVNYLQTIQVQSSIVLIAIQGLDNMDDTDFVDFMFMGGLFAGLCIGLLSGFFIGWYL